MPLDTERKIVGATVNKFKQHLGRVPHGWMTPNYDISMETYNIIQEAGLRYTTDWVNDDQPFWQETANGKLLHIPNSLECNDHFLSFAARMPGPEFAGAIEDTFDQLWSDGGKSGRVMAIGLHSFISGQPMRAQYVRQFLQHIKKREQVWLTTADAIYDFTANPETWQEDHDW
jgi:peptidoglycan/xylan/chitin deacetylase (PgdA/CDA1 family)